MTTECIQKEQVEQLRVQVYSDREQLGRAAAEEAVACIRGLLASKTGPLRIVFAAAPSQNEFLEHLVHAQGIDWTRILAFHMDEYLGLPNNAPQRFGEFLTNHLFSKVPFGKVHLIDCTGDVVAECKRYGDLIDEASIDIVCLGIGENGHLAFNDPPVADFSDTEKLKVVVLEEACRRQQVNDGCFSELEKVPTHAVTLSIPVLMSAAHLFCIVPGRTKYQAVQATVRGPISTACPASVLRLHSDCTLYVDKESFYGQNS